MPSKVFNISLPEELVTKVDALAASQFKNRSELIRDALSDYLRANAGWNVLEEARAPYGKKRWPEDYIGSQKDLWAGVDVQEYLDQERAAW